MRKPPVIYRYFREEKFCEDFILKGKTLFRPLSYFITCEDSTRKDYTESMNIFEPKNGLEITKLDSNEKMILPLKLISSVVRPDQVFLYCSSTQLSAKLFNKFEATVCVEIDTIKFEYHIEKQLKKMFRKNFVYSSQIVEYYDPSLPPDTRHADPERIIFSKPRSFSDESEFRFAFSQDKNIFNVNNVSYILADEPASSPITTVNNEFFLELGSIERFCRKLFSSDIPC